MMIECRPTDPKLKPLETNAQKAKHAQKPLLRAATCPRITPPHTHSTCAVCVGPTRVPTHAGLNPDMPAPTRRNAPRRHPTPVLENDETTPFFRGGALHDSIMNRSFVWWFAPQFIVRLLRRRHQPAIRAGSGGHFFPRMQHFLQKKKMS